MSRVFFKQLLLAASLSAALVSAPARAQSEASLVLSASSRIACDLFVPAMSTVTAVSSSSFPICLNTAERNQGSSSGAVPSPIKGSLYAPL